MNPELLLYKFLQLRGARFRKDLCNGISISSFCIQPRRSKSRNRDVVILHGIGSSGAHFGPILFRIASLGYTVHVPDLPGHGLSDNHLHRLTSHELYETVIQWMKKVAPEKFALIGNSLGGALAWRYASDEPERISKLILLSPAIGFESSEVWKTFVKSLEVPDHQTARDYLSRFTARSSIFHRLVVPSVFRNMNRKAVRDLLETTGYSELAPLQNPEISVPTLMIWGAQDDLLPKSNLAWVRRSIPKSVELLVPEGVGHCPQMDSPRWLLEVLKKALP